MSEYKTVYCYELDIAPMCHELEREGWEIVSILPSSRRRPILIVCRRPVV